MALVIFDCDGVLVDSEPISNREMAALLAELGYPMPVEEATRLFMGNSMASCLEIIERLLGQPAPADFAQRHHERCFAAFERELQPVPGIVEALDQITLPTCVASGSDHTRLRKALGLTGLLPRFEGRIFSAVDVGKGKPFPDLFLHAARTLGAAPADCIVVEDTVLGVQAAVAAGMPVLGYAGRNDGETLAAAGARVFHDMRDLPALLQAVEAGR